MTIEERNAIIDKAIETTERAKERVRRAKEVEGIEVHTSVDLDAKIAELKRHKNDRRINKMTMDHIKEVAANTTTYYDNTIFYTFDSAEISDDGRKTDRKVVKKSEAQMKKLRSKESKMATKTGDSKLLSEEEIDALFLWYKAMSDGVVIGEMSTKLGQTVFESEENEREFVKKFKVSRETTFGGNSQLINALSYTFGCYPRGTKFVMYVQEAMKNPRVWLEMERAYRNNTDNIATLIDQATGDDWYENFKVFAPLLDAIIENAYSIDSDLANSLNDLRNEGEEITGDMY